MDAAPMATTTVCDLSVTFEIEGCCFILHNYKYDITIVSLPYLTQYRATLLIYSCYTTTYSFTRPWHCWLDSSLEVLDMFWIEVMK